MKTMLKTKISTKKLVAIAIVTLAVGSTVLGLTFISKKTGQRLNKNPYEKSTPQMVPAGDSLLTTETGVSATSLSLSGIQSTDTFNDGGTIMAFAHQDDDLLWMEPFWQYTKKFVLAAFPASIYHKEIVNKIAYYAYPTKWAHPWGEENDFAVYISKWISPGTERGTITVANIKNKIRPYVANSNTKRIITHNNWGEYGHIHHRLVNQAVRELAVEYGKDAWSISMKVPWKNGSPDMDQYADTGTFGMPYVDLNFDHAMFKNVKNIYQQKENELIAMNKWAVTNIWSWGDGEYQYPSGTRKFIKIVDKGRDLTIGNSAIQSIVNEIPVYGQSAVQPSGINYYKGGLYGTAVIKQNPQTGVSTYCAGPKPSDGTNYGGALNAPISCDSNKMPKCSSGFRRVLTGAANISATETEKYFTCEKMDGQNPPTYVKGELYGTAVIKQNPQTGVISYCSGQNSPISCGADKIPRCKAGFRRTLTGNMVVNSTETQKYFTCEAMDFPVAAYSKGKIYSAAVIKQNPQTGVSTYCAGPKPSDGTNYGGALNAPISCDSNKMPKCSSGFRRVMTGSAIISSTEKEIYATCERMQ